ncbi:radical SAM protein [Candidatus Bathyarchaeota archaeon]|nr:MAG: radical SAM protein [Candidatus Bathyarchaeota archaeon]
MNKPRFPEKIRVSIGSAIVLGLTQGTLDAKPTTIYLLTYQPSKCHANCGFCPQAKTSKGRADLLSRVSWPPFPTEQVLHGIAQAAKRGEMKRVCIQALNYPTVFNDLLSLTKEIRLRTKIPLSISCQPLSRKQMKVLAEAGVDRVSIALDAATEELFNAVKGTSANGPYTWKKQLKALREAVQTFGRGSVTTHLIAGLGENEKELIQIIQWCVDNGIYPSLFAFTPIPGTALENHPQPSLSYYRRIQIAHFLIIQGKTRYENMRFNKENRLIDFGVPEEHVRNVIRTGRPFLTSGCPGCNRPYYNERPGGPLYNYPRQPLPEEIVEIEKQIQM